MLSLRPSYYLNQILFAYHYLRLQVQFLKLRLPSTLVSSFFTQARLNRSNLLNLNLVQQVSKG